MSNLEYPKTVNCMMRQHIIVTGVSWEMVSSVTHQYIFVF